VNKPEPTASDIARLRDASEWVQRLSEPNSEALADQWLRWCGSDPMNLRVFEQMQRIWDAFPEVSGTTLHPPPVLNRPTHRNGLIALAASVVLLLGVAGWFAWHDSDEQVLDTAIGEQRRITLADGSHLDLAPGSRVITHFTLTKRDVRLERGQAFFQVAHNATRPFIVHANNLTITAVGTEFDVRVGPDATAVTVMEGRIKVSPDAEKMDKGRARTEIIRADIGQRVTFSKSAHQFSVGSVDPKVASSWRGGTLQFVGESLEEVVGVINRYSTTHIVVAPALQQTRFTGTVSPPTVRDWFKALEQIYAVEVIDQGTDGILIRSRTRNAIRS
jgi:transmembrane sensor